MKLLKSLPVAFFAVFGLAGISVSVNANQACDVMSGECTVMKSDIVGTAAEAGSFNTLLLAVEKAGLTNVLQSDGPFTVFAPTDEAFAKIPKEQLEKIINDRDLLAKILTYHVVPGKVMSTQVVTIDRATTVQGQDIKIQTSQAGVKVNDANVIATDVVASNGVIHVIDQVILPQ